jgi:hypothetical protein
MGVIRVTPKQFKAALKALGLSQGRAAKLCGLHPRSAKRWAGGQRKVPEPVSIILRLLLSGALTIEQLESIAPPKRKP